MFSFVRRLFGKKKEEKDEAPEVKEELPVGAPPPYSMNFEEATKIVVSARDCSRKHVEAVMHHIVRPYEVEPIVELLKDLPKAGEVEMEMDQCTEHTLTAYKGDERFAMVTFYKGHLKLEDGKFMVNDEKLLKKQTELYSLIKIDLSKEK